MKKVLWVTPGIYPLDGGRQLGSWGYIKAINNICKLKVVSRLEETVKKNDISKATLDGIDVVFEYPYLHRNILTKFRNLISKWSSRKLALTPINDAFLSALLKTAKTFQPDIIVIDHITMFNYYRILKKKYRNAVFIYNSHNVEYANFTAEKGRRQFWVELRKSYEHELLRDCNATLCVSRYDIEDLKKEFCDCNNLLYAKPLIYFESIRNENDILKFSKNLLIVGSMNWYPNVRGIIWFIENVFAKLIIDDPEYKLYLVGNKPMTELRDIAEQYSPNIVLTGWVPDTDTYFRKCDISIVPVFEGTGAKIKVLESIGKSIPTICSSFAAKDYDVNDELIIADNAEEFLLAIKAIQNQTDLRRELVCKMQIYYDSYFKLNPEIQELFE